MPMKTLTPAADSYTEPVQVERDGTVITEAGIGSLGLQPLVDQCAYLRNRTLGAVAGARIYLPVLNALDLSPGWGPVPGGYGRVMRQNNTTLAASLLMHASIAAQQGTLVRAVAEVHGGDSHLGLPATMPQLVVSTGYTFVGGGVSALYQQSDTSASVPEYEAPHTIELALALPVSAGVAQNIQVEMVGETGANALNDKLQLGAVWLEIDP